MILIFTIEINNHLFLRNFLFYSSYYSSESDNAGLGIMTL